MRPVVVSERSCVGVRDPGRYQEIYVWVYETRGAILNFFVGVRDPRKNPKFLCECKRLEV